MLDLKIIKELVLKQKILDNAILKAKNLELTNDLKNKKIIAFFVELGEFINEEKSFKFWKVHNDVIRERLVEEYIDGVHFLLSIGVDIDFNFDTLQIDDLKIDITENYLLLVEFLASFISKRSDISYKKLAEIFFNIANILNISEEEFINSYNQKNKINYQRQENDY